MDIMWEMINFAQRRLAHVQMANPPRATNAYITVKSSASHAMVGTICLQTHAWPTYAISHHIALVVLLQMKDNLTATVGLATLALSSMTWHALRLAVVSATPSRNHAPRTQRPQQAFGASGVHFLRQEPARHQVYVPMKRVSLNHVRSQVKIAVTYQVRVRQATMILL
jgi:hypothetical protein